MVLSKLPRITLFLGLILLLCSSAYGLSNTSLVGYFPADETSATDNLLNAFNSALPFTRAGSISVFTNGVTGNSRGKYPFTSSDYFGSTDNTLKTSGNANYTLIIWHNGTTGVNAASYRIYQSYNATNNGFGLQITSSGSNYAFNFRNISANTLITGSAVQSQKLKMVTVRMFRYNITTSTYTNYTFYIDGTIISSLVQRFGSTAQSLTINGGAIRIGNSFGASGDGYEGTIDEISKWDRPLSDAEISEIYNCGIAGKNLSICMYGYPIAYVGTSSPANNTIINGREVNFTQNITYSDKTNCSLILDSTSYGTQEITNPTNQQVNWSGYILSEGTHDYQINCSESLTPLFSFTINAINFTNTFSPANKTQFTTTNITFTQEVLLNSEANCSLYLNQILNTTTANTVSTNLSLNKLVNNLSLNNYSWSCCIDTVCENTTLKTIYVDSQMPNITDTNLTSGDYIQFRYLNKYFTFGDNALFNWSILLDGTQINTSLISGASSTLNYTLNLTSASNGNHNLTVIIYDGYWSNLNNFNITYQINLSSTINMTFYDEILGTKINTVTADFVSDTYSNNYSTTNGNIFIDLPYSIDYAIRYVSPGYNERFYYFSFANHTVSNVNLYLLNQSAATNITATVYNELNQLQEGVYIKVYKFNPPTNTFILREIAKTNWQGLAHFQVAFNDEFYKFELEYPLETNRFTTTPSYVTTTTMTFRIPTFSTGNNFEDKQLVLDGIQYSLLYYNTSKIVNFTWLNNNGATGRFCLKIINTNIAGSTNIVSTQCLENTPPNSITYNASQLNGSIQASAYMEGSSYVIATLRTILTTSIGGYLYEMIGYQEAYMWEVFMILVISFGFSAISVLMIFWGVFIALLIGMIITLIPISIATVTMTFIIVVIAAVITSTKGFK